MTNALAPGARLGSYEVLDRLGAGGMGEVYRARDLRLDRTVALKVLRTGADPELLHRLEREARAASALNHPNIVHIYDVGEAEALAGMRFVVMEHVEGETLRRRLAPGPLPLAEAVDLAVQLADGLASAHRAGIVHRDLKPENLMVTRDGRLKILDFGLAKRLSAPLPAAGDVETRETLSRHATKAGMLLGTLEYMSPEQAAGRPLDHRTDQFSFGLIVYEMCTGRPAFHRETPAQVLAAVIERDPEPLRLLRPEAPEALEALVTRCLQKDPDRRFPATDTLLADTLALAGRSRAGSMAPSPSAPPPLPLPAVVVRPPEAPRPSLYHVQTNEKVKRFDEQELASEIRDGKLTGLELVRYDDQEEWRPLFESRVYRREVPSLGDPRRAAQLRELRAAGGHLTGFFITSIVMYATQGHFPFWLGIWGAVLLMQLASAAPTAFDLWRRRSPPSPPEGIAAGGPAEPSARPAALPPPAAPLRPPPLPPSPVEQEAARVRALLEQRGGLDVSGLVAEVDRIVALTAALAARQADLAEQTTEEERGSVTRSLAEAQGRLEQADSDTDRRLFERQVDVLRGREDAIAKARRVLERLRVRQEVAHHQLKQVRLDLSRDAAGALGAPELSSRLEFIRYEIDAKDEVAEIAAEARRREEG